MSLKSFVYLTIIAHFHLDQPHFKDSVTTCGYCIKCVWGGQRLGSEPWRVPTIKWGGSGRPKKCPVGSWGREWLRKRNGNSKNSVIEVRKENFKRNSSSPKTNSSSSPHRPDHLPAFCLSEEHNPSMIQARRNHSWHLSLPYPPCVMHCHRFSICLLNLSQIHLPL